MSAKFEKLLEPIQINRAKLKNRMIKTAQATGFADSDGTVNQRVTAYYEAIAQGGVAMIVVGGSRLDPRTRNILPGESIDDDSFLPGLTEIARVIHRHDCVPFIQINHSGPGISKAAFGFQAFSASPLRGDEKPVPFLDDAAEASLSEIKNVTNLFANAAERAKKAGFEGVEVHAAHNYLLNSFLSRAWNKRSDEYGCQNMENRTRFLVEVIQAIKERVGPDFAVGVRLNSQEWGYKDGITTEETVEFAKIVEKNGGDYIHTSGCGGRIYPDLRVPDMLLYPEPELPGSEEVKTGLFVPTAAAVKKAVSIPVIVVGRMDPELGEKILREGKADIIAFGRRIIADHELPRKVAEGRLEDIAPCTACLECQSRIRQNKAARCRINATMGKEKEYVIKPAARKKRVMVIGGGPGGLEAARIAALRGHEVALYEKEPHLGGLIPVASMVKGTGLEELPKIVEYLKNQNFKLGVKINLGKEIDLAFIRKVMPDVVIIAAGGAPALPDIPGIDGPNVVQPAQLHRRLKFLLRFFGPSFLGWATKLWLPLGKKVVIIGGAIQGCELAYFLVKRGREVTIAETSDTLGTGIALQHVDRLVLWFKNKGVTTLTEVKYKEITGKGLTIITKDGKEQTLEADTILPAMPEKPNQELLKALQGVVAEVYTVGDCREPNLIVDAIDDGYRTGLSI